MTASLIIWMSTLTVSTALLVLSAAKHAASLHMVVSGVVALVVALAAVQECRTMRAQGESDASIASTNARSMGLVWTWGAVALFSTYNFVLTWREWFPFFMAFVTAAGLCLFFSATLKKDEASGQYDPIMKKIGRYLPIGQVAGMVAVMIGLIVDGKLMRFAKARPGWEDWAANNIFFFGAMALTAIGAHALLSSRPRAAAPA